MNLRTAALATAACAALAACITIDSGAPAPIGALKCSANAACKTDVSVQSFFLFWKQAGVADQTMQLNGAKSVTWTVTTAGYMFPDDGIKFSLKTGGLDPTGVFDCKKSENSLTFTCSVNDNARRGAYAYTIKLTGIDNPFPLDPWVYN